MKKAYKSKTIYKTKYESIPREYLICEDLERLNLTEDGLKKIEKGDYKKTLLEVLKQRESDIVTNKHCVKNMKDARAYKKKMTNKQ